MPVIPSAVTHFGSAHFTQPRLSEDQRPGTALDAVASTSQDNDGANRLDWIASWGLLGCRALTRMTLYFQSLPANANRVQAAR